MKSKRKTYLSKLKKEKWSQWKASRLRSDWRTRAKKLNIDLDTVPLRPEIQLWLERQLPFKCYLSGVSLTKSTIELDHKISTSRGGSFRLTNIGITSKKLNSEKGNMSEEEFRSLLKLINKWEDKGKSLLSRLRCSNNIFRRR